MESRHQNVELIDEAIKSLLEEMKNKGASGDDNKDDHLLLSRLLSQLESLKGNSPGIQEAEPAEVTETSEGGDDVVAKSKNGGDEEYDRDEIVKELNHLKRQNTITHGLLSAMLVMIIAWQASEVTMLLKLKHGLSHPFSYIGSVLGSFFAGGSDQNGYDEKQRKSHAFPSLKMPELPSVELPDIGVTGKKHRGSGN